MAKWHAFSRFKEHRRNGQHRLSIGPEDDCAAREERGI